MLYVMNLITQLALWFASQTFAVQCVSTVLTWVGFSAAGLFARGVHKTTKDAGRYVFYGGMLVTIIAVIKYPIFTTYFAIFSWTFWILGWFDLSDNRAMVFGLISITAMANICAAVTDAAIQELKRKVADRVKLLTETVSGWVWRFFKDACVGFWNSNVAVLTFSAIIVGLAYYERTRTPNCVENGESVPLGVDPIVCGSSRHQRLVDRMHAWHSTNFLLLLLPLLVARMFFITPNATANQENNCGGNDLEASPSWWNLKALYTMWMSDEDNTFHEASPWQSIVFFFNNMRILQTLKPHTYLTMESDDESVDANYSLENDEDVYEDDDLEYDFGEKNCTNDWCIGSFTCNDGRRHSTRLRSGHTEYP